MTTKEETKTLLTNCTPSIIKEVLHTNNVQTNEHSSREECIEALVHGIWNHSHTPIGGLVAPKSLEDIIQIYAQKIDIPIDSKTSVQSQLGVLRSKVMANCNTIEISDIPPEVLDRLQRSVIPSVVGAGAAGGAATTRWAAYKILAWTASKWLNIIKLIPQIGPALITIRSTAGVLARISGPVGVALAIWSINNHLGPKWDKCLGLLIGLAFCLDESDEILLPKKD
ncbi:MAG: hypothetical protein CL916_06830 [Deltaproteobacteria bacterium]|nr:hypothetical protein [Deltaproteobacteria bacterium]